MSEELRPDTEKSLNEARQVEIKSGRAAEKLAQAAGEDFGAVAPDNPRPTRGPYKKG